MRGALVGCLLALGAPTGWLAIRAASVGTFGLDWVSAELSSNLLLYGYLLSTTALAFVLFGVWLGSQTKHHRQRALEDPLTGLPNRRAFESAVEAALGRGQASLLLIDLDRFKQVNDDLGHAAGDALLVAAGASLRSSLRRGDQCARIGGDEFAVLLPQTTREDARAIALRVLANLTPVTRSFHPVCGASIGVASQPRGGAMMRLVNLADRALYRAKAERGSVRG